MNRERVADILYKNIPANYFNDYQICLLIADRIIAEEGKKLPKITCTDKQAEEYIKHIEEENKPKAEEGKDNKKLYFGSNDHPSPEVYKMEGKYGYIGDRKDAPYVEDLIKQPQQPKLPEIEEIEQIISNNEFRCGIQMEPYMLVYHKSLANEILDYLKARE